MSEKSEYRKKYYNENKERILLQMMTKMHCDICNKAVSKCNMEKHRRSSSHIRKAESKGDLLERIDRLETRIKELEEYKKM